MPVLFKSHTFFLISGGTDRRQPASGVSTTLLHGETENDQFPATPSFLFKKCCQNISSPSVCLVIFYPFGKPRNTKQVPRRSVGARSRRQKNTHKIGVLMMVPGEGVEPSHPLGRQILSLLRLPFRHPGLDGAGEGNRTLVASLEGWSSAIELRPRKRGRILAFLIERVKGAYT